MLLALLGALFFSQGLAKALDPTDYMVALDRFRVLPPVTASPVPLAAVALSWTVIEVAIGASLATAAAGRASSPHTTLASLGAAVGLAVAYLALEVGAWVRGLPIDNVTWFGGYLGARLTPWVIASGVAVLAVLAVEARELLRSIRAIPAVFVDADA